nr:MAG TPA: Radical SAM superfamily [Caudoviricetes sp.]
MSTPSHKNIDHFQCVIIFLSNSCSYECSYSSLFSKTL